MRILLCVALLFACCARSNTVVNSLPENLTGEYKITIDGVGRPEREANFVVFRDSVVPVMFPDATWVFVKVESPEEEGTYRIYSHTLNQPASEAEWFTLRNLGQGKLLVILSDNLEMIFTKVGEIPRHFAPN